MNEFFPGVEDLECKAIMGRAFVSSMVFLTDSEAVFPMLGTPRCEPENQTLDFDDRLVSALEIQRHDSLNARSNHSVRARL